MIHGDSATRKGKELQLYMYQDCLMVDQMQTIHVRCLDKKAPATALVYKGNLNGKLAYHDKIF